MTSTQERIVQWAESMRKVRGSVSSTYIDGDVKAIATAEGTRVFVNDVEVKQISCGCCTNGCTCLNHMDIPRGIRPQRCSLHSKSGQVEFLRGGAA